MSRLDNDVECSFYIKDLETGGFIEQAMRFKFGTLWIILTILHNSTSECALRIVDLNPITMVSNVFLLVSRYGRERSAV